MKDCKSTSQLIREFREANHVTQQAFADGVGVSKITVYRWEHGIAEPSMEHAKGIEAVFGLRLISPQNQVTYNGERTSNLGICESSEAALLENVLDLLVGDLAALVEREEHYQEGPDKSSPQGPPEYGWPIERACPGASYKT